MAGTDDSGDAGFLSRWSRRKVLVRQGAVAPEPPAPAPALPAVAAAVATPAPAAPAETQTPAAPALAAPEAVAVAAEAPPPPTLADVALLDHQSDFSRFMAPGVDTGVKNAALKKLFTDPHFNVMDRLDTYIDDYGQPDPLPAGMLRQMAQSQFLGLFTDEPEAAGAAVAAAAPPLGPTPLAPPLGPPLGPTSIAAIPPTVDGAPAADAPALLTPPSDEDADLRLQPLDAAGPAGPDQGPGPDAGRQH